VLAACGRVDFDARTDAPASCPSSALLCDDFETGGLTKWDGTRISVGGSLLVDSSAARAGTWGLDATMPALADGSISAAAHVGCT
jgi:hypothetical protein